MTVLNFVDGDILYEPLTAKGDGLFTGSEAEPPKRDTKPEETLKIEAKEADVFATMPWESYVEGCIGCGTCTYLCPTCHCFNLRDAEDKGIVTRTRVWDSCMYRSLPCMPADTIQGRKNIKDSDSVSSTNIFTFPRTTDLRHAPDADAAYVLVRAVLISEIPCPILWSA